MTTARRTRSSSPRKGAPAREPGRAYRGQTPEARRAARRERLVEAAIAVFGTTGFRGATVRQICGEAGLTERYFYESFDNQSSLFDAAYGRAVEALRVTLVQAVVAAPPGLGPMAESALRAFYGALQRDPRAARILLIEIYGAVDDLDRLYQRGVRDFAALVRGVIEANLRVEEAGLDAELLATAVVGASTHLATRWLLGGYRESIETMVANSLAIVLAVGRQLPGAPRV